MADDLKVLFEYYDRILGYPPGVADKYLLTRYARSYEYLPFEYQTIVESFLREFHPDPKKLDDIPVKLWII